MGRIGQVRVGFGGGTRGSRRKLVSGGRATLARWSQPATPDRRCSSPQAQTESRKESPFKSRGIRPSPISRRPERHGKPGSRRSCSGAGSGVV